MRFIRITNRLSGASAGELVYPVEQVEWAVRSVEYGSILQNVESCRCMIRGLIPDRLTASRNIRRRWSSSLQSRYVKVTCPSRNPPPSDATNQKHVVYLPTLEAITAECRRLRERLKHRRDPYRRQLPVDPPQTPSAS